MRRITYVAEFIRNMTYVCVRVSVLVRVYICVKGSVRVRAFVNIFVCVCTCVCVTDWQRKREGDRGEGVGGGREKRERPRMSRHRPMLWEDRVVARKHACDAPTNELRVLHI